MSIKILVADDSKSDILIIKNMLDAYEILTACDGREALRRLDENRDIHLLILDLNMPDMSGFEVLAAMKSDDRYSGIRTIILTNYDEVENEIKGLELGAVDYIRKPIHMHSLKARIGIHIELLKVQHELEQKYFQQGLTFDTIFNQAPVGIAISFSSKASLPEWNKYYSVNPLFEKITGRSKDELIVIGWEKITHPDDVGKDLSNYKKLLAGEISTYTMDKRIIRPDGSIVWVRMIVASLTISEENKFNHICLIQDITEQKCVEADLIESERSKSVLLSHIPGMAYRCKNDREWTMQYISTGCFELTGHRPESLINNSEMAFVDVIALEYHDFLRTEWERTLESRLPFNFEYEIITAKGDRKWVLEMGQGVYDEGGQPEALEGIILDISDRKLIENRLRYNNEHDSSTGLYNRSYLENLLINDAEKIPCGNRAVISINLTAVQSLTMEFGFHYTQDLIRQIVEALMIHCTHDRQLFNTYENRFVFYVKNYTDRSELTQFCEEVSNTLDSLLTSERVSGGIGIIEIDGSNQGNVDQLLKNLLIASEKATAEDKDFELCFYDRDLEEQILREQEIVRELASIASDEGDRGLFLQYQPIIDLKTDRICGFEALARLNSEKLGMVSPLEFIPIAEKTKLIIPVGKKIIRQALKFLKKLMKSSEEGLSVSINISVMQILKKDFCGYLFDMINEIDVPPENIGLEVTESVFSSNYEEINSILGMLKYAGLKIAIDDFGTGYSSLAREKELNITCIKIDKAFIDDILITDTDRTITGDIVSMAHKFSHCAIAEGVEQAEQKEYLKICGCDKIQGYLISRPLDEEKAIGLLKK